MIKKLMGWIIMGCILMTTEVLPKTALDSDPTILILLGPPGSGKGTHACPLSKELGLPHISTGDLLRNQIQQGSPLGREAKEYTSQGKLVPDELVLKILLARIENEDCQKGYILDGFPRTKAQAEALHQVIQKQSNVLALHFQIEDNYLIERIVGRIVCKDCGRSYHRLFDPPAENNLCDHCRGTLCVREDDQEAVVRDRIKVYHSQTKPLIDYYAGLDRLVEINSKNSKKQVFQDLLNGLKNRQFIQL